MDNLKKGNLKVNINSELVEINKRIDALERAIKDDESKIYSLDHQGSFNDRTNDIAEDIINLIHIALTIPILGMLFLTSEKHIGCTIASFVLWGMAAIIITVYYKIYPYVSEMLDGRLGEIIDYSYMASPIFSLVAFILAIIAVAV